MQAKQYGVALHGLNNSRHHLTEMIEKRGRFGAFAADSLFTRHALGHATNTSLWTRLRHPCLNRACREDADRFPIQSIICGVDPLRSLKLLAHQERRCRISSIASPLYTAKSLRELLVGSPRPSSVASAAGMFGPSPMWLREGPQGARKDRARVRRCHKYH
jgi:hypothetical protein